MNYKILVGSAAALLFLGAGCSTQTKPEAQTTVPQPPAQTDAYNNTINSNPNQSIENITMTTPTSSPEPEISTQPTPATTLTIDQKLNFKKPTMEIDKNKMYTAVLHTTKGDITIELNAKATPITVNNFVALSRATFYNNTPFHRTIPGFMIQGGDPQGNGTGGPGYRFDDEPFKGEYTRGTVAMANAGPNTNGSQFFIMHADYPLPPNYVIFGKVTKGMEVVDAIATAPTRPGGEASTPVSPVVVNAVTVSEK